MTRKVSRSPVPCIVSGAPTARPSSLGELLGDQRARLARLSQHRTGDEMEVVELRLGDGIDAEDRDRRRQRLARTRVRSEIGAPLERRRDDLDARRAP